MFQPIGLRLSLSNQSRAVISTLAFHCLIREAPLRPIRTVLFRPIELRIWSPHLHEYRPFRDHGQGLLSLCQLPSGSGSTFPFHLRLKAAFPWLEMKHQRHLSRAEQVEQEEPSNWKAALSQNCLAQDQVTAALAHN